MKKFILIAACLLFNLCICVAQNEQSQLVDTTIYTSADVPPEFPGGQTALFSFLAETVQYPKEAREQGIAGTVVVRFVVEKDGSISNVTTITPRCPVLDEVAIQAFKMMPKWDPATINDEPVRIYYDTPITFSMSIPDIKRAQKTSKKAQKK